MPAIWAAGITAVGGIAAAAMTEAPEMESAMLDSSGWNVAFPGASITSSRAEGIDPIDADMKRYLLYFAVAAGVILLVKQLKK